MVPAEQQTDHLPRTVRTVQASSRNWVKKLLTLHHTQNQAAWGDAGCGLKGRNSPGVDKTHRIISGEGETLI